MKGKSVVFFLLIVGVAVLVRPRAAAAGEPTEQIRAAINDGVEILNKARLDNQSGRTETIDQEYAEVHTKLLSRKGDSYAVDYRLLRVGGKWRVYDVVAEGISLVNNYRSQFNRVMANSSFEELIRKMKEKSV